MIELQLTLCRAVQHSSKVRSFMAELHLIWWIHAASGEARKEERKVRNQQPTQAKDREKWEDLATNTHRHTHDRRANVKQQKPISLEKKISCKINPISMK